MWLVLLVSKDLARHPTIHYPHNPWTPYGWVFASSWCPGDSESESGSDDSDGEEREEETFLMATAYINQFLWVIPKIKCHIVTFSKLPLCFQSQWNHRPWCLSTPFFWFRTLMRSRALPTGSRQPSLLYSWQGMQHDPSVIWLDNGNFAQKFHTQNWIFRTFFKNTQFQVKLLSETDWETTSTCCFFC